MLIDISFINIIVASNITSAISPLLPLSWFVLLSLIIINYIVLRALVRVAIIFCVVLMLLNIVKEKNNCLGAKERYTWPSLMMRNVLCFRIPWSSNGLIDIPNTVWFCYNTIFMECGSYKVRACIRFGIHRRPAISRPHGRSTECLW